MYGPRPNLTSVNAVALRDRTYRFTSPRDYLNGHLPYLRRRFPVSQAHLRRRFSVSQIHRHHGKASGDGRHCRRLHDAGETEATGAPLRRYGHHRPRSLLPRHPRLLQVRFKISASDLCRSGSDLMSMRELLEEKHPTAWLEFEKGLIDETELAKKFFKDGRPFDLEGLKECMYRGYSYLDGIEEVLRVLKQNKYELHAFTNYPVWYKMIEQKLNLSKYLSWTFSSCIIGKRKPSLDFYMEVVNHLKVEPSSCVFIDDRLTNVEAAMNAGMIGIHFKNADSLKQVLSSLGIELAVLNNK